MDSKEPFVVEFAGLAVLAGLNWEDASTASRGGAKAAVRAAIKERGKGKVLLQVDSNKERAAFVFVPAGTPWLKATRIAGAAWIANSYAKADFPVAYFYPVAPEEEDMWWLVGANGGVVITGMDVVGTLDECLAVYQETYSLGIDFRVVAPEPLHKHFDTAAHIRAADIVEGTPHPMIGGGDGDASPLLLLAAGAVAILAMGGGWWAYNAYIKQPPPKPQPPGPPISEIEAHNNQEKRRAVEAAIKRIYTTTSADDLLSVCMERAKSIGWKPPGWKLKDISCKSTSLTARYTKERYGTYQGLSLYLGVSPNGPELSLDISRRDAGYTQPITGLRRRSVKGGVPDLPDLAFYVNNVLPGLEKAKATMPVHTQVTKAKPITVPYNGWNANGKETPMVSKPAYKEGVIKVSGENLVRLPYAIRLISYPEIRINEIRFTPGSAGMNWTVESNYVLQPKTKKNK
ncbi:type 4b pilus protein PilO2 [Thiolapillus sp.]|uniref:type 4b pilus protein PilO2 n=1 Tax=Thiolapillus sp. TaxID=2017437 RepID=UPI003AF8029C